MNKFQGVLKLFLVVAALGLAGAMAVYGLYGYKKLAVAKHTVATKDKELERLSASEMELKKQLESVEDEQKTLATENEQMKKDAEKAESEKKVIISQVKNSIDSFETFRNQAAAEIQRLSQASSDLETEKKKLQDQIAQSQQSDTAEKEKMGQDLKNLNAEIDQHKVAEARLRSSVRKKDKAGIVQETAKLHYNLGNFYYKNRNFKDARREYEKAVFYNPNDADAHFNLAVLCDETLEDRDAAMVHYKKYLELKPELKPGDRKRQEIEERIMDLEFVEKIQIGAPKPKEGNSFFKKDDPKPLSKPEMAGDQN